MLIKLLPVILSGFLIFNNFRIVGAISANIPDLAIVVALLNSLATTEKGTGFNECSVFFEPTGLGISSALP